MVDSEDIVLFRSCRGRGFSKLTFLHSSHGIVKAFAENKESVKKYDVELLHRKLNFKISAFQIKKKNRTDG